MSEPKVIEAHIVLLTAINKELSGLKQTHQAQQKESADLIARLKEKLFEAERTEHHRKKDLESLQGQLCDAQQRYDVLTLKFLAVQGNQCAQDILSIDTGIEAGDSQAKAKSHESP